MSLKLFVKSLFKSSLKEAAPKTIHSKSRSDSKIVKKK